LSEITRRRLLHATAAGGTVAGVALVGVGGAVESAAASTATAPNPQPPAEVVATSGDPRYAYLTTRGQNTRFVSQPQAVYQVFSAEEVVKAVNQAVAAGQQIAVRSGGHCLDDLVDNAQVKAVIDVSQLNRVHYDPVYNAVSIGSGATLGDAYTKTWLAWNVAIPGGTCPTVGSGGLVQGGGFGAMCRQYGMCVDHLYGIEIVVIGASGKAELIVATCEADDPNRSLWWAHTGSGGGNYGVVTRFLFRSPNAVGTDPAGLLPSPPPTVLVTTAVWPWSEMTEAAFTTLVGNHGAWHAANSAPGNAYASMFSALILEQSNVGQIALIAEIDGTLSNASALMTSYLDALNAGVGVSYELEQTSMPWLNAELAGLYGGSSDGLTRSKGKGAYLRESFDAAQIAVLYQKLTGVTYPGLGAMALFSYGGQVNAVSPTATANPHRDSILLCYLAAYWAEPAQDDEYMAWLRGFYTDLFAASGGVPASNASTDGTYINYPDVDLADPAQNTSGVAWSTLYFGENYPRLTQVKQTYDPGNVFRHPLSIGLPS
jgi:FAD/FMN-containing dehydrogenase